MVNEELIQAMSQMLDNKLLPIHGKLDQMNGRLGRIEVTIENELRPNIKILAEGYTMLHDKLSYLEAVCTDLSEKVDILLPATKRNSMEIDKLKSL